MRASWGVAVMVCVGLGGCGAPMAPSLVSAQSPPGTGMVNDASEPQPRNSLPPGAANVSSAPGATQPQYLSRTIRGF